jgi:hypothetical protein
MALKARMRLLEGKEIDNFLNSKKNVPNHVLGSNPKLLIIDMNGSSTDGETEIDAVTNKMQLTTAEALELVSASSDDNNSGTGHCEKVTCIVVTDENEPTNHEITMHATDGTTVMTTTDTFLDAWHVHASEWGSGDKDCAGQVDLRKVDDTVIASIAAGANEGEGSGFKIPKGWLGALLNGYIQADGTQAADEGKILKMYVNDAIDAATDVNVLNYIITEIYGSNNRFQEVKCDKILQSETEITFFIDRVDDGNEDFVAHLEFLLWKK